MDEHAWAYCCKSSKLSQKFSGPLVKKHNEFVLSNDVMWEVVKESNEIDDLLCHELGCNFKFMKKMICPIPFLLFWGWKSNDQIVPNMHKGQHHNL
jgi:hypothetical protein